MDIHFEQPTIDDAPALIEVQIRAFHDDARLHPGVELGGPPGYDSVDVMVQDIQEILCHKIVHEGQIIGGITLFDRGHGHYHLDRLFVDPAYHNRGVGARAMQFIETAYPDAKLWTLDTPLYATRNQHFYEKMGYVKVGEKMDEIALISYEKKL